MVTCGQQLRVKLTNFHRAGVRGQQLPKILGLPDISLPCDDFYAAPETFAEPWGHGRAKAVDSWSLGVVLLDVLAYDPSRLRVLYKDHHSYTASAVKTVREHAEHSGWGT